MVDNEVNSKKGLTFDKTGVFKKDFVWGGGWTEIYNATIDLKGFLKGFANHLMTNKDVGFTDVLGDEDSGDFFDYYPDSSEFAKTSDHFTRNKNQLEKKFVWIKHNGYNELELEWKAKCKTKYSEFGWVVFKFDFVARMIRDVEVVENDKKVIKQNASWELRNTLVYRNDYVKKTLWRIPIIKDSPELQRLMVDHMYAANIEKDLDFVAKKVKPLIWGYLEKHLK